MAQGDLWTSQYADNILLKAQQLDTQIAQYYEPISISGSEKVSVDFNGDVDFTAVTARDANTVYSNPEEERRWIVGTEYHLAIPFEFYDTYRMMNDPTSPAIRASAAALNRLKDQVIIDAATATAVSGKDGTGSSAYSPTSVNGHTNAFNSANASNVLDADFDVDLTNQGLTLNKILEAKYILDSFNVEMENRIMIVGSNDMKALLNTTEIKNADYNSVKALANGDVNTFAGFKFIQINSLNTTGGQTQALALHKDALAFGLDANIYGEFTRNPTKNNRKELHMDVYLGAVRAEDKRMVEIRTV